MPEWDGEERRHDGGLTEVKDELSSVRQALVHVAEGMESFVSTDEIDRRIDYERRQRNKVATVIAVGVFVAIISIFVNIAQLRDLHNRAVTNRAANQVAQNVTIQAVNCIVHNLVAHRNANEFAHHYLAATMGKPYTEPAELVPPVEDDQIERSCEELNRLLKVTTTKTTGATR